MMQKLFRLVVLGAIIVVAVALGYFLSNSVSTAPHSILSRDSTPLPVDSMGSTPIVPDRGDAGLQEKFAVVAEKCIPAVVVVTTVRKIAVMKGPHANLFDYLYGRSEVDYRSVPSGQGSGFLVRPDGYILTNYHIVRGQSYFKAVLSDGSEHEASLIGVDPLSDLALLKIDVGRQLPFLKFASSGSIKTGHWAIAIGAPFSLAHTMTVGVVSQTERMGVGMNVHENYIQTDASINPGNSGGPLLNLEGKVIGVNDFILSPSSGNIGLSFAIASSLAERVCEELIKNGKVIRPWLGISMRRCNESEKRKIGGDGVVIDRIYRNSPAHRAKLRTGDIILTMDNKRVSNESEVRFVVMSKRPKEHVNTKINRQGREYEVEVIVDVPPENLFRH